MRDNRDDDSLGSSSHNRKGTTLKKPGTLGIYALITDHDDRIHGNGDLTHTRRFTEIPSRRRSKYNGAPQRWLRMRLNATMDPAVCQKYASIEDDLKSELQKWKRFRPYFEAVLRTNVKPSVKLLTIKSITHLKNRIDAAISNHDRAINYVVVVYTIYQLNTVELNFLEKPYSGVHLKEIAGNIRSKINILLSKFEGNKNKTVSFKKLPYEFQNRLVALLPPRDLVTFKYTGKTAMKYANQRCFNFSDCLVVARNDVHYEKAKNRYAKNEYFDVVHANHFLKSNSYYVDKGLVLNIEDTEHYEYATKMLSVIVLSCNSDPQDKSGHPRLILMCG
uniref:DUF3800 domain-containing protein n=1 Tax=Panagrellus redivivus TaxID=6233 RepID=A0A7E4VDF6_PANRE